MCPFFLSGTVIDSTLSPSPHSGTYAAWNRCLSLQEALSVYPSLQPCHHESPRYSRHYRLWTAYVLWQCLCDHCKPCPVPPEQSFRALCPVLMLPRLAAAIWGIGSVHELWLFAASGQHSDWHPCHPRMCCSPVSETWIGESKTWV